MSGGSTATTPFGAMDRDRPIPPVRMGTAAEREERAERVAPVEPEPRVELAAREERAERAALAAPAEPVA
jgi:hypothetical protein